MKILKTLLMSIISLTSISAFADPDPNIPIIDQGSGPFDETFSHQYSQLEDGYVLNDDYVITSVVVSTSGENYDEAEYGVYYSLYALAVTAYEDEGDNLAILSDIEKEISGYTWGQGPFSDYDSASASVHGADRLLLWVDTYLYGSSDGYVTWFARAKASVF